MFTIDALGELNWLAVIVATIVYMAMGALWYQPFTFGKTWAEKSGIDISQNPNPIIYVWTMLAYFVMVLGISFVAIHAGASTVGDGIGIGLLFSLAFVGPTLFVNTLYQKKSWTVYYIDKAFNMLAFVVVGIIIAVWD